MTYWQIINDISIQKRQLLWQFSQQRQHRQQLAEIFDLAGQNQAAQLLRQFDQIGCGWLGNDCDALGKKMMYSGIKKLRELQSKYVVVYYNSWLVDNTLSIQMELCSQNLRNILKHTTEIFLRQPEEQLDLYEYFLSCEIFKEILECVHYLHELKPPIIHRNLKPENLLIAKNVVNGRFIKLGDFMLATEHHDMNDNTRKRHTADVGDIRYMAPEVTSGKDYNHKSDVYALALIGAEIFDVDLHDDLE
ncbi:unnamed protein product, partial [Oppiella nova]